MTRRQLLLGMPAFLQNRRQRTIIFMVDGLGADYIAASAMPVLASWQSKGIGKIVDGVMPSVTNANNTSICCGVWPEKHGITANYYLDETTGREEYMESDDLVLAPTLFAGVAPDHLLAQDEIFGPVQIVIPFTSEDEAIRIANGTEYGLVAGVWTRDGSRAMRLMRAVRAGQVFINNYGAGGGVELPFGGVGRSGHGREKGFEALYAFTRLKTVAAFHG